MRIKELIAELKYFDEEMEVFVSKKNGPYDYSDGMLKEIFRIHHVYRDCDNNFFFIEDEKYLNMTENEVKYFKECILLK